MRAARAVSRAFDGAFGFDSDSRKRSVSDVEKYATLSDAGLAPAPVSLSLVLGCDQGARALCDCALVAPASFPNLVFQPFLVDCELR